MVVVTDLVIQFLTFQTGMPLLVQLKIMRIALQIEGRVKDIK